MPLPSNKAASNAGNNKTVILTKELFLPCHFFITLKTLFRRLLRFLRHQKTHLSERDETLLLERPETP